MLESVFILSICAGFIFFILGIEQENVVYALTSMLMWIVVLAGHIYVVVPNAEGYYYEIGFFAISLGFIMINVIWVIILYFDLDYWRNKEEWTKRTNWMKHR